MRFARFISTDIKQNHILQSHIVHVHGKDNYYIYIYMYWIKNIILFEFINNMLQLVSL